MSKGRKIWLEISSTIKHICREGLNLLPTLLIILNPLLTLVTAMAIYKKYDAWKIEILICPFVLLLITYFATVVRRVVLHEFHGLPVGRRRFTKRDERGCVSFEMSELVEMIEYLAAVEDYCQRHGLYHFYNTKRKEEE